MKYTIELLGSLQMGIPAELETQLRVAVDEWKANNRDKSELLLKAAADLATKFGYL